MNMKLCMKSSGNKCYGVNKERKGLDSISWGALNMVDKEKLWDKVTFEQRPGEGEGPGREQQGAKSLEAWQARPEDVMVAKYTEEKKVRKQQGQAVHALAHECKGFGFLAE